MRIENQKVDCEFLDKEKSEKTGIGGRLLVRFIPVCKCYGTENNPRRMNRKFFEVCAECEHNKWTEGQ